MISRKNISLCKTAGIAIVSAAVLFCSCSKAGAEGKATKPVNASSQEKSWVDDEIVNTEVPVQQMKSAPKVNPDIEKLGRVLSSMSDRAKDAIPNGNPEEFLADLYIVLEAEKTFRQDDVSLYYLIDKKHNIGGDYIPKDLVDLVKNDSYSISRSDLSLRPDAEAALVKMANAAKADGQRLLVSSTYRSYEYQKKVFQKWVEIDGLEEAERESARAGTSQHQLGTAIDFGNIDDSFAETEMCRWLNENAMDYGWSLSFPQGYEDVTGYRWECWHFRYIGKEACAFQKKWFGNIQQFMLEFLDAWKE